MKSLLKLSLVFMSIANFANDGAFYVKGSQLVPINETDISIKKEILHIKKILNEYIEVSVYYEFFNPLEEKQIIVGFEALPPSGDIDENILTDGHPYINDFTIDMNDRALDYQVTNVNDSLYLKMIEPNLKMTNSAKDNLKQNHTAFYYVYFFNAKFKKGLNIIKHTYKFRLSHSIDIDYNFAYVLTAANRWKNGQIDDFKLILDMGEFETFNVKKGFFESTNEWKINGVGKTEDMPKGEFPLFDTPSLKFHIQKGTIIFEKRNFKPMRDLFIFSVNYIGMENLSYIPFSYYQEDNIRPSEPKSDFEYRILRNLPFARRGYIFKDTKLKAYYDRLDWYIPNINYVPQVEKLTPREKRWIDIWKV